ncbi:hypothetical protein KGF54_002307 [Candida jiufengensis]|uniref:uncharacterized protein n=1 Tax=Candida jiufengensis TaxID=497108 RepID=UPI002224794C|nr:uncharacterized protein KGF54_002307 [Candida jiufengensis]KAI5954532.1 hypothetical protein KGF54_002307 [Candida jiufengensis]
MMLQKRLSTQLLLKRYYSIDYITYSIPNGEFKLSDLYKDEKRQQPKHYNQKLRKKIINPDMLNRIFQEDGYESYSKKQITQSQKFFKNFKVNLDWTLTDYNEIPSVKYEILRNEQSAKSQDSTSSRKTFGIKPELLTNLPEILIIGHTNVGKSSLVNNLLKPKKTLNKLDQLAYVSARAGYTKTLNCFRLSNKLRIIDSPGYGKRAIGTQGDMVINYINERQQLKKVLFLVDSVEGFRNEDKHIIDHLIEQGIPFDIVFTKMDEVLKKYFKNDIFKLEYPDDKIKEGNQKVLEYYYDLLEDSNLNNSVISPRYLFNNTQLNNFIGEFQGTKSIRCNILESCNLLTTT